MGKLILPLICPKCGGKHINAYDEAISRYLVEQHESGVLEAPHDTSDDIEPVMGVIMLKCQNDRCGHAWDIDDPYTPRPWWK